MRDYQFDGTPVTKLPTELIHVLIPVCDQEPHYVSPGGLLMRDVAERLRLELFIRERNLRSGL